MKDTNILTSKLKDVNDRQLLIDKYLTTGILDRDDAVSKIKELREKDKDIMTFTSVKLAQNAIPFDFATDLQLIEELKMQVQLLEVEISQMGVNC